MLKAIDLAELNKERRPAMSYEEYRAELLKPHAEQNGLKSMPSDMRCTGESAVRMGDSIARVTSANVAARA